MVIAAANYCKKSQYPLNFKENIGVRNVCIVRYGEFPDLEINKGTERLSQTKQMNSFLLAAVTVISFIFAEDFAEDNAEGYCPNGDCPIFCPPETLMTAAELLFNNWCSIIDEKSLNQLEDLVTEESMIHIVMQNGQECAETGFVRYLDNMIPLMPDLSCPTNGTVSAVFMDGKHKVVVLGNSVLNVGEEPLNFRDRHVFEVVNGCELRLIESSIVQVECLPA